MSEANLRMIRKVLRKDHGCIIASFNPVVHIFLYFEKICTFSFFIYLLSVGIRTCTCIWQLGSSGCHSPQPPRAHQPARDDRGVGSRDGEAAAQRHRVERRAHGRRGREAGSDAGGQGVPGRMRNGGPHLFCQSCKLTITPVASKSASRCIGATSP